MKHPAGARRPTSRLETRRPDALRLLQSITRQPRDAFTSKVELHAELQEASHQRAGRTQPGAAGRAGVPCRHPQHGACVERVVDVEDALHSARSTEPDRLDEANVGLARALLELALRRHYVDLESRGRPRREIALKGWCDQRVVGE